MTQSIWSSVISSVSSREQSSLAYIHPDMNLSTPSGYYTSHHCLSGRCISAATFPVICCVDVWLRWPIWRPKDTANDFQSLFKGKKYPVDLVYCFVTLLTANFRNVLGNQMLFPGWSQSWSRCSLCTKSRPVFCWWHRNVPLWTKAQGWSLIRSFCYQAQIRLILPRDHLLI